ncbi:hypothetical protein [Hahella ganghwensis]|uniref:hypothetical protein n=1 Tax=Hahella ganghwensis TaxID=286420 RepID=UPI00037DD10F|nr:hypothetical protein [Hahella ganghwensis]
MRQLALILTLALLQGCAVNEQLKDLTGLSVSMSSKEEGKLESSIQDPLGTNQNINEFPVVSRLTVKKVGADSFTVNNQEHKLEIPINELSKSSATGAVTLLTFRDFAGDGYIKLYDLHTLHFKSDGQITRRSKWGTIERNASFYHFVGEDGQRIQGGTGIILGSKGVLFNNQDSVVTYIEQGRSNRFTLPEGARVIPRQNSDISASRHIGLLKPLRDNALLGLASKDSHKYALMLFSLDTGQVTTALEVSLEGKSYDRQLDKLSSMWQVHSVSSGPILVSLETSGTQVVARNLKTQKKRILEEKTFGISYFHSGVESGGQDVWVNIANGLSESKVNSVQDLL